MVGDIMAVYAICDNGCLKETLTKEQIFNETITCDNIGEIFIENTIEYDYDGETLTNPVERTLILGGENIVLTGNNKIIVDTVQRNFYPGDKIILQGSCTDDASVRPIQVVGCSILVSGKPGDETLDFDTAFSYMKSYPCYYSGEVFETIEFEIDAEFTGYAAIGFINGNTDFRFKNAKIVFSQNNANVQLKCGKEKIYPKTINVINESGDVPDTISIGNREEHRYLENTISSPIAIHSEIGDNDDFYAMIVVKTAFAETMTAGEFIVDTSNCIVVNPELDITLFSVVHVSLYYDGISICAVVSGYTMTK